MPTPPDKPRRNAWFLGAFIVLIAVVLVLFLYKAVDYSREAANRETCGFNLRGIAIGLHTYYDTYKSFPPAYVADENGKPMHSWRVLVFPQLRPTDFTELYNSNEPWNGPSNRRLAEGVPLPPTADLMSPRTSTGAFPGPSAIWKCPSDPNPDHYLTNYVRIIGDGMLSLGEHSVRIHDVPDGKRETIIVVEIANSDIHWMEPRDLHVDEISFKINDPSKPSISSHHPGGANVVFVDAHVEFLDESTDPIQIKAMLTVSGGEDVKRD